MSATIASWCARLLGASLALCVLTVPFHPATAAAQDDGVSDSLDSAARTLFEDGRHAFETGDFETALERFRQAYEISRRVPLLWNIAATLDRLRRDEEALDMFEQYIAAVPAAANRDEVMGRIRVLREAVEARRAEDAAREAEAARLEEERRRIEAERLAREGGGGGGGDTDAPASSGGITPVVFIVAAGLTAVAGGVLIWSGVDTLTANDNYVAAAEANRPLAEIESLYGSAIDAQTRTNVLIGVTSALAITSLVLVFFTDWGGGGGETASASTTVSILPTFDLSPAGELGGAGLSLRGTF